MKTFSNYLAIFFILQLFACEEIENIELKIDDTPNVAGLFGEGIISTGLYERDLAITPDGNELIYTLGDYKQSKRCLVKMKNVNGKWTKPEILNISGEYQDIEPFYSNNGQRLFFASDRPLNNLKESTDYNIWYSNREEEIWSGPIALSENINKSNDEFYPSLSSNQNLYFTSTRDNGIGREDIFVSRFENGKYLEAVPLDTMINSEFFEFNAFINPDESLLIFSSFGRADDMGGGDLYYSQKDEKGNWSKAKNMGSRINSDRLDYCPFIDSDQKIFYFTSERMVELKNEIKSVEELTNYANQPQNGMGDIYRISTTELDFN